MRHRRVHGTAAGAPDPARRPEAPRVPRLRLRGRRGRRRRRRRPRRAGRGEARRPRDEARGGAARRPLRRRPHALGDARPPLGGERPSSSRRLRSDRRHPQRHHRELPAAEEGAPARRCCLHLGDRHGSRRPGARRRGPPRAAKAVRRGRPGDARDPPGDVRPRPLFRRRARRSLRGEVGAPDRPRAGRGGELRRERRDGPPPLHTQPPFSRGWRPRASDGRRHCRHGHRGRAAAAGVPARPVGRRCRREGRLPALHGEGDRRAADGRGRDGRKQALPRDGPVRRRGDGDPSRPAGGRRADPRRSLRNELACGARRQVPPRGDRADPDGGRLRLRVPLPLAGRRQTDPRRRDLAVGRDGRHGRGAQGGAAPRGAHRRRRQRPRLGDRADGRRRPRDARGAGDRRRLDEGVHDPARRSRPLRAVRARLARRGAPRSRGPFRQGAGAPPHRDARGARSLSRRRKALGAAPAAPATSSTSAAARTTRSRSRGR